MTAPNSTQPHDSLQRPWRAAFLAALRQCGNIRRACEACGIGRRTAYDLRGADPTFAAQWDEAQEDFADLLEEEAIRRAMGTKELVIHQGKPCGIWVLNGEVVTDTTPGAKLIPLYENRYSDGLIQFELRGRRRAKYDPPKEAPPPTEQQGNADEVLADIYAEQVASGAIDPGAAGASEDGAAVDPHIQTTGGSVPESSG